MGKQLLNKIKSIEVGLPRGRHLTAGARDNITNEEIEVALAWLRDEVQATQMNIYLGTGPTGNYLYWMAIRLREAYRRGMIKETETT